MPIVFRAMHSADDGGPLVEPSARGLGVRADYDLPVDENGNVEPESGGLTVRPTMKAIPRQYRKDRFTVWKLDTDALPEALRHVEDNPKHGSVEPAWAMSFDDYEAAIADTRSDWVAVET